MAGLANDPEGVDEAHQAAAQMQNPTDTTLRLETLPTDIRRYLLPFLDLEQLSALVHASPVYHAQYRKDRCRLLTTSMERTAPDAFTIRLYQTRKSEFEQDVPEFLQSYSGPSSKARKYLDLEGRIDLNAAIDMARFYFNVVKPLANSYASQAMKNLAEEAGDANAISLQELKLTSSERMRLTRAIYRFQLLCDIVNRDDYFDNEQRVANAQALFDTLDPWEVEEIVAFLEFAKTKYAKLIEDVRWDLHPDNPKFDDQNRPPTPNGAVDFEDEMLIEWYYEGLTLRGPDLLHTALLDIEDHDHLVALIRDNIISSNILDVEMGILGDTHQETRYRETPTERNKLQEAQVPMPFQGDGKPDAPPLAWTIFWRGWYSSLYGDFIPAVLRRCGYVFWDAETLKSSKGLELLEREMEDFIDPRDDMY